MQKDAKLINIFDSSAPKDVVNPEYSVSRREAVDTIFTVYGMTRLGIEPTT